jgi:bacteriochlorophyll 4-vinyl reductase
MNDSGIGRLLVASLHQGIADLLPSRLEFYESWLNPSGLREGRIGLAPLAAALSFLRQEGEAYKLVAGRAGEYAAEWTVADLPAFERTILRVMPDALRPRLVARIVRRMIRRTYGGSRALARWRERRGWFDIRGSVFCEVREAADQPLCEFYASAIRRLMQLFNVHVDVETDRCRATGAAQCVLSVHVRQHAATSDGVLQEL